ncbi:UNVERIFIED_ORG: aryl-alcohol dehydrogenase-like predicted oxidoreductase [Microbispora rosea subsp. rosea]
MGRLGLDDYVLATKVYFPMGEGRNDYGLSRKHVMSAIDASLARLGTDYVDLYQIHRWDAETPDVLIAVGPLGASAAGRSSCSPSGRQGRIPRPPREIITINP